METVTKQPYEQFWIGVDFSNNLQYNEVIDTSLSTVTAMDKDGVDATAELIVPNMLRSTGTRLMAQIKNGVELNSPYKVTFRIVTNATPSNKWEHDVQVLVHDE
jgi:hypothetical protein